MYGPICKFNYKDDACIIWSSWNLVVNFPFLPHFVQIGLNLEVPVMKYKIQVTPILSYRCVFECGQKLLEIIKTSHLSISTWTLSWLNAQVIYNSIQKRGDISLDRIFWKLLSSDLNVIYICWNTFQTNLMGYPCWCYSAHVWLWPVIQ